MFGGDHPVTHSHFLPLYVHPRLPLNATQPLPIPLLAQPVGRLTLFFRENNMLDAVEAAVVRKKRKADAMQKKARAQAKKMVDVDVAL